MLKKTILALKGQTNIEAASTLSNSSFIRDKKKNAGNVIYSPQIYNTTEHTGASLTRPDNPTRRAAPHDEVGRAAHEERRGSLTIL